MVKTIIIRILVCGILRKQNKVVKWLVRWTDRRDMTLLFKQFKLNKMIGTQY